jgi:hypothetical protein
VKFAGDPLLDDDVRAAQIARGGSGVVTLERDADGVLHAVRDIVLPE